MDTKLYINMKKKADAGKAKDCYKFAMRLKEGNCKRDMPATVEEYEEYFNEIVYYFEKSAESIPEAKLELAQTYLELAAAYQRMKNKDAFFENADKGLAWFEIAIRTGKFNKYIEDYQIIKNNIEKIKTEL